jgi:hypothetical protein
MTSFAPTTIHFTQRVYGTSGASAGYATFDNSKYGNTLVSTFPGSSVTAPNWQYFKHDGVPPSEHGTATHPSFGNWTFSPTADSRGGSYHLYCCSPL